MGGSETREKLADLGAASPVTWARHRMSAPVGRETDVGWRECCDVPGRKDAVEGSTVSALTSSAPWLLRSTAVQSFKFSLQEIALSSRKCT